MRITKPRRDEDPAYINKQIALQECKICPACGSKFVNPNTDNKGNFLPTYYTDYRPFWNLTFKRMEYACQECGCKYESDPYDYNPEPNERFNTSSMIFAVICFGIAVILSIAHESLWLIILSIFCGVISSILTVLGEITYKRHIPEYDPVEVHVDISNMNLDETTESEPNVVKIGIDSVNPVKIMRQTHRVIHGTNAYTFVGKFDETVIYFPGDLAVYEDKVYLCKIHCRGPWKSANWRLMTTQNAPIKEPQIFKTY